MKFLTLISTLFLIHTYNLYFSCNAKLTISVYYETYCIWSKKFLEEVEKTNRKLGDYIQWDLVPYGFAKVVVNNGKFTRVCHHGKKECRGNKVHACILNQINETQNNKINMIYCVTQTTYTDNEINKCALQFFFGIDELRDCIMGNKGEGLLEAYRMRTEFTNPMGVPYVYFNGFSNDTLIRNAWNLSKTSCQLLNYEPSPCKEFLRKY